MPCHCLRRACRHHQFLLPARRLASAGDGGDGRRAWSCRHRHRRPQQLCRRRARPSMKRESDQVKLLVGTQPRHRRRFRSRSPIRPIGKPMAGSAGYSREAISRHKKGECHLAFDDILAASEGQMLIAMPPRRPRRRLHRALVALARAKRRDALFLPALIFYRGDEPRRLAPARRTRRARAARRSSPSTTSSIMRRNAACLPMSSPASARNARSPRRASGSSANAERHLKSPEEMARLFAGSRGRDRAHASRSPRPASFSLDELRYEYPDEPVPPGKTRQQHLEDLTWAGAHRRYPEGVPDRSSRELSARNSRSSPGSITRATS